MRAARGLPRLPAGVRVLGFGIVPSLYGGDSGWTHFVENAGYNEWADANDIVVLYPQARSREFQGSIQHANPQGCWDLGPVGLHRCQLPHAGRPAHQGRVEDGPGAGAEAGAASVTRAMTVNRPRRLCARCGAGAGVSDRQLESAQRGVRIVTGPPGAGKSAVMGRLATLSDPEYRYAKGGLEQKVVPTAVGSTIELLPNPRYRPGLVAEVVEERAWRLSGGPSPRACLCRLTLPASV